MSVQTRERNLLYMFKNSKRHQSLCHYGCVCPRFCSDRTNSSTMTSQSKGEFTSDLSVICNTCYLEERNGFVVVVTLPGKLFRTVGPILEVLYVSSFVPMFLTGLSFFFSFFF